MRYEVRGFVAGLTATLVSTVALLCIYLVSRRRTSCHKTMNGSGHIQTEADALLPQPDQRAEGKEPKEIELCSIGNDQVKEGGNDPLSDP